MSVLVDTSVWSCVLRRAVPRPSEIVDAMDRLIGDRRVKIIGPIRQELLSGIRDARQFKRLAARLEAFPDLPLQADDYVTAARYFNTCCAKGIQGSNTDFLICAAAVRHKLAIFTTDGDFKHFADLLPIRLHSPE